MTVIKTNIGTYGNINSLICDMKARDIKEVIIEEYTYIFTPIGFKNMKYTIEELVKAFR